MAYGLWLFLIACNTPATQNGGLIGSNLEDPAPIDDPTVDVFIEDDAATITELQYEPDQLLVQVIPGNINDVTSLASAVGATVASFNDKTRMLSLHMPADQLPSAAASLSAMPEIEQLEREYHLPVAATPTDPFYSYQWYMHQIHAEEAWELSTGHTSLVVAVVDSGIDSNHPDLRTRLTPGYNLVGGNSDANDCCGHGTQVAGLIGAIANNGFGIAGTTWNGLIMPVRVASAEGAEITAKPSTVADGMIWAVDHGADIINVSFSGVLSSPTIQAAAQYAHKNGRLVVAAMGNSGKRDSSPNSPWCFSVSATAMDQSQASFTTYGPGVDLAAPGDEIITTLMGGAYGHVSGTSFSAPLVSGVAALAWSIRPEATPDDIAAWLTSGAEPLDGDKFGELFGSGRLDAAGTLNTAFNAPLPPDVTAPVVQFTSHASGAHLTGKARVDLDVTDEGTVNELILSMDGREVARDLSAPYAFLIDTRLAGSGLHILSAVASDVAGNLSQEAAIHVTFDPSPDDSPPTITLDSPADGDTLSGRVTIAARLADPDGLQRISLLLDGHRLVQRDLKGTSVRVNISWNASGTGVAPGGHTLTITATNQSGLIGTASRTVTTGT